MLSRSWLCVFLFGLILANSAQAQNQDDASNQSTPEQQTEPIEFPNPLSVIVVESDETTSARQAEERISRQNEEDDLIAQQGMNASTQAMNEATQSMKRASWVSASLVGIGTLLLIWTLWLTRSANKAAVSAVEVTERIGRDQSRAYVHIKSIRWKESGEKITFTLFVENTGTTPAKRFYIDAVFDAVKKNSDFLIFNEVPAETNGWSALPGNEVFQLRFIPRPLSGFSEIAKRNARKDLLVVRGVVRYETIYGETYESEFSFMGSGRGITQTNDAEYGSLGTKMYRTTEIIRVFEPVDRSKHR